MYTPQARLHARVKSRQAAAQAQMEKPDFCVAGAIAASAFALVTAAAAVFIAAQSRKKRYCKHR